MKYKEYNVRILTQASDMYKIYDLAKLLNPLMSFDDYKLTIDKMCNLSDYRQVVVYDKENLPVSFIAIQSTLLMSAAPALTLNLSNIATLPEHRGHVTKFLLRYVHEIARFEGYGHEDIRSKKTNDLATYCYSKAGFENTGSYAWRRPVSKELEPKEKEEHSQWRARITEQKANGSLRAKL